MCGQVARSVGHQSGSGLSSLLEHLNGIAGNNRACQTFGIPSAGRICRLLLPLFPGYLPEALHAQARGFLAQGKYEEARDVLQRVVEDDAEFDAAWASLARAHRALRSYQQGLDAIEKAIQLQPQSFRHRISLGNFYRAFGEFEEAARSYREAIELKPNSMSAWNNLGSILLMSDPEEAADAFRNALKIDDEYGAAWSNLGTAHYYMEDYEAAEESYRRALEVQPKDVVHYRNLADALVMLGKDDELRTVYSQASELARSEAASRPNDPVARMHVGIFCARAGDVKCALEEVTQAEAMQPENAHILFRSACVYAILNRLDTAVDRLETAVKFGLKKAEIENDPDLRVLHDNPRYKRILELAG